MSSLETGISRPDRCSDILLEYTRSICPFCKRVIDAQVVARQNRVIMRKRCEEHGWIEGLISSDVEMYMGAGRFNKPGTKPLRYETRAKEGCPHDCGLCPEHKQHTCVAIFEIIRGCDLRCPTCFAGSAPGLGNALPLSLLEEMMDAYLSSEGNPDTLQLSGGEPTLHPQFLEILDRAKERGFRNIVVNTNGRRIALDRKFAEKVTERGVNVFLQFDGFRLETNLALRGEDLRRVREDALRNLGEAGGNVVLSVTVQKGVNEDEIGDIVRLLHGTPHIRGVNFQPTFFVERHPDFDSMERTTLPDVVLAIAEQTRGWYDASDFLPIPCPYPTCSAVSYAFVGGDEVFPLARAIQVEDYLDYFKNVSAPHMSTVVRDALEGLYSMSTVGFAEEMKKGMCTACGVSLNLDWKRLESNVKMILVKPFMDGYTFDLKRLMKCCVHLMTPDKRLIPFCAYNNLYRNSK
ncbi:MAG: radical SAM protein [Armatimonadetes bacterium]|nr:radical SAM protein [Armatimonadota bacterium]